MEHKPLCPSLAGTEYDLKLMIWISPIWFVAGPQSDFQFQQQINVENEKYLYLNMEI